MSERMRLRMAPTRSLLVNRPHYDADMIDRVARDRLALTLRRLAAGRITNDECDDVISEFLDGRDRPGFCRCGYDLRGGPHEHCPECGAVSDPALPEIARFAWGLYSDLSTHKLKGRHALSSSQRRLVAQAVAFLKTDLEYSQQVFTRSNSGPRAVLVLYLGVPMLTYLLVRLCWGSDRAMLVAISMYLLLIGTGWLWALASSARAGRNKATESTKGDDEALAQRWPFNSPVEMRSAAARPRFLAGASSRSDTTSR